MLTAFLILFLSPTCCCGLIPQIRPGPTPLESFWGPLGIAGLLGYWLSRRGVTPRAAFRLGAIAALGMVSIIWLAASHEFRPWQLPDRNAVPWVVQVTATVVVSQAVLAWMGASLQLATAQWVGTGSDVPLEHGRLAVEPRQFHLIDLAFLVSWLALWLATVRPHLALEIADSDLSGRHLLLPAGAIVEGLAAWGPLLLIGRLWKMKPAIPDAGDLVWLVLGVEAWLGLGEHLIWPAFTGLDYETPFSEFGWELALMQLWLASSLGYLGALRGQGHLWRGLCLALFAEQVLRAAMFLDVPWLSTLYAYRIEIPLHLLGFVLPLVFAGLLLIQAAYSRAPLSLGRGVVLVIVLIQSVLALAIVAASRR